MPIKNPSSFVPCLSLIALFNGVTFLNQSQGAVLPPVVHTVNLGWNIVPETGVQGYRIYVGNESQQYTQTYDTGTDVTFPVDGLEFGKTYYFAVKAIGGNGLESNFSKELQVTIAPPSLPFGTSLASTGVGQTGLQWSFPRSELGASPEFIVEASNDLVNWTQVATVMPSESVGGDLQSVRFSWAVEISDNRKFFRLTARNWMGFSAAE